MEAGYDGQKTAFYALVAGARPPRATPIVRFEVLRDADARIRTRAVESLVQSGGVRRTRAHAVQSSDDVVRAFVDHRELERDVPLATKLLAELADDDRVRDRVIEVAKSLLREDDLGAETKARLEEVIA